MRKVRSVGKVLRTKRTISASPAVWAEIAALRQHSTDLLAPQVQSAVAQALDEIRFNATGIPIGSECVALDAEVFETLRSDELQQIYYEQGTSNAKTALKSWHGYGLAVDIISRRFEWFDNAAARAKWPNASTRAAAGRRWFEAVAAVMEKHGMSWGGRWTSPDQPHFQWWLCAKSPRKAPAIYEAAGGGLAGCQAVWEVVDAA